MAPKKKQTKLDRVQLEQASAERIDAVTADPLHPVKYVEIVSPDGKLSLFYNTSTLVRIGLDKGQFMQPPHFREPMRDDLKKLVEELEGKRILFENVSHRSAAAVDVDGALATEIQHRHVHFQQIVDEFYLLSPADVYVCPTCFSRWLDANPDWTRPVDPLDALQEIDDDRLSQIVFRYARDFNKHLANHHWMADDSKDHTLRAVLCTFFSDFNEVHSRKLSLHWYWIMNARYNVVRYNRVVDVVEAAQRIGDVWTHCPFPDPVERETKLRKRGQADVAEPFIVSDEDESGEDDGAFGIPVYEQSPSDGSDGSDSSEEDEDERARPLKRRRSPSSDDEEMESDTSVSSMEHRGYIKPHPTTDRRTYTERAYVQREMEKIRRREMKDFASSTVRRSQLNSSSQTHDLPEDDAEWGNFINSETPSSDKRPAKQSAMQMLLDDDEDG